MTRFTDLFIIVLFVLCMVHIIHPDFWMKSLLLIGIIVCALRDCGGG